jgi:glycerol-3-phosphate cytidylyltransferase
MIVGFTCGAWDLFHAGHNVLLRDCKLHCDKLIVGLHTDPTIDRKTKNKPVQTVFERYLQLQNCKWVDEIIPYDTEVDLENLIATIPLNKRFVGEDYLGKNITGDNLCKQLDIEIVYLKRRHTFSTTELRRRIEHAN